MASLLATGCHQISNLVSHVAAPKPWRKGFPGPCTKISSSWSSGISVSLEPWAFGTTSCIRSRRQLNDYIGTAEWGRTAWPWLSGWISRKARIRSLSNSLKEGMSHTGGHCFKYGVNEGQLRLRPTLFTADDGWHWDKTKPPFFWILTVWDTRYTLYGPPQR